ncbi:MAG: ATP-binding cassette domain-containing protein [Pseudomonadota bacterium]|nr:ATP-binding cassette domain-containing protein [Pseudomonadota bacterium]
MEVKLTGLAAGPQPQLTVLQDVSLGLSSGEQVALIGPSGAGKTTLLHVLGMALAPQAGTLRHDGRDVWALGGAARQRARAGVFLAPQTPPLPPRQRVVTAVLAARLAQMGLWRSLRAWVLPLEPALAEQALRRFDLADKLYERVDRLSGGERQRVGLARALVSPASLWLVDEPLSSLDPVRARQAVQALTAAAAARGATLAVSFHQVDVALACFPRVIGVRDGRIVFDRASAEVDPDSLARLYAGDSVASEAAPAA